MSPQEYLLLNQPQLSHPARTLYILHLRKSGLQSQPVYPNYPDLGRALAVTDPSAPNGFSFQVTGKQLTHLFNELSVAGLINVEQLEDDENHFHLKPVFLPLLNKSTLPIRQQAFAMYVTWKPDESFQQLCQLCGLIDTHYNEAELGEFIAYWLGQPEKYSTQHQWMMKFIKMLKNQRYQKQSVELVGYQTTQPSLESSHGPSQRALEMMEKAKGLSEKG